MNKIIVLWSVPRSLSTPFERIMIERGDLKIVHEPYSYFTYVQEGQPISHFKPDPKHPTTYPDIKNMILSAGEKQHAFLKEMPYTAIDLFLKDEEFLRRLTNTFLIRDPDKTIRSLYVMWPEMKFEEIGFEASFRLFRKVADLTGKIPIVIDADDFEDNTEGLMMAYCDAVEIPFIPKSIHWENGSDKRWVPFKEWHLDLDQSKGVVKDMERFDFSLDEKPKLRWYYECSLPFYQAMYKHRLTPKRK